MKKVLGFLLGIFLVVSAQAVTINWKIPTGDYTSEATFYFVYSTTQVASSDYGSLYTATSSLSEGGTSGNYTYFGANRIGDNKVTTTYEALDATTATGYYYLMVFKTSDDSLYAVGGGKQYSSSGTTGIYDTATVDGESSAPDVGAYVDMGGFIGGTWTAAIVPEPTLLSLLAFGIAGLALRRKSLC